ncbi:unnamed protein product [Ilex paraguariensis]|uniref:DUF4378 domain-containing protein n=1 Tax=Ilex paraguariensis TaxID=185542 RepID=A0ABC8UY29_9AQUA
MEPNSEKRKALLQEENQKEMKEKERVSVESSRTSVSSSSCSSTFSSVDCNKTAQTEPSIFCQSIVPETTPTRISPVRQPNPLHPSQQSIAIQDVVKDSMYREARGVSVKTMSTEDGRVYVMKHIDSPRLLQQAKSVQPRATGFDGPIRVLDKVQEARWKEGKDGFRPLALKDAPRFSYDGRESREKIKSTLKLKELPRLSLDSRAGSIRSSASESRSNYLLSDLQRENVNSDQFRNLHQEPGNNKRTSGVVAKLMGLEPFPDSITGKQGQMMKIKACPDEDCSTISRSSRIAHESKRDQVSGSPKVSHRDPASPGLRNANSVMKPTSNTRVPLELAPWKQPEGGQGSQKLAFKYREAPINSSHASSSVYGEMEKRLTELEFKKSGKDLRALKQILEAMQKTRQRLENRKEEQTSDSESQTSKVGQNYSSLDQGSKLVMPQSQHRSHPVSPVNKATNLTTRFESRIMVMKPTKITGSSQILIDGLSGLQKLRTANSANNKMDFHDKQTTKERTPRNNNLRHPSSQPLLSMDIKTNARTKRSNQTAKAPEHKVGECFSSTGRSSGTASPRLQQKKHGIEKESRPTTPSSDLSKSRRQYNTQPQESASPRRKPKLKSSILQQGDAQSSEMSGETGNLSHQGDTISVHSEGNASLASQIDTEVTSRDRSNEINGTFHLSDTNDRKFAARWSEDRLMAELATATSEKPSPVSVLDAMFYAEESPSPVKMSRAFQDDETSNSDEAEWHPEDLSHSRTPNLISEFSNKKFENIKHLVHKFRQLDSTSDEATADHIASPLESKNPDHRYITEILLASGLLKYLGSCLTAIQLQPSGHVLNPNLFHVIEQSRQSTELGNKNHNGKIAQSKTKEKTKRKQIFDVVNEILFRKLAFERSYKLGGKSLSGQKLLEELCSEICHLQANPDCGLDEEDDGLTSILSADMKHQSEDWTDHHGEIPGLVLDIERLIFKDLISEIVSGEAADLQYQSRKHCRQLFSK